MVLNALPFFEFQSNVGIQFPVSLQKLSFFQQNDLPDYFHPSMLEDPWATLEEQLKYSSSMDSSAPGPNPSLSDSLIPQIGDSFFERNINPAPDVEKDKSVDDQLDSIEKNPNVSLSDSMIPMVGDSICMSEDSVQEN